MFALAEVVIAAVADDPRIGAFMDRIEKGRRSRRHRRRQWRSGQPQRVDGKMSVVINLWSGTGGSSRARHARGSSPEEQNSASDPARKAATLNDTGIRTCPQRGSLPNFKCIPEAGRAPPMVIGSEQARPFL